MCPITLGFYQVYHGFGLHQIEAAIQKCSLGKFPCLGIAYACCLQGSKYPTQYIGRAMAGDLYYVLARIAFGASEKAEDDLVQHFGIVGIASKQAAI